MSEIAIRAERLGKQYRIGALHQRPDTLRDAVVGGVARLAARLQPEGRERRAVDADATIWALRDVSFEIERGEVVGVIGRNGAGKSTLLKILSRITEPTTGRAEIHGRVGSLLEVGTGFHAELTGRENIYLNGAILGMRRSEIDAKFDDIVAFSEIEKFLDTPVKRYSSGMYVRLAFAVAAHLEPEILLVDEVLAVGDAAFQKKCLGRMGDVAKEGRTVLFVSHNMGAVTALCSRALLLTDGSLARDGAATEVVDSYSLIADGSKGLTPTVCAVEEGGEAVRIVGCVIRPDTPRTGGPLEFEMTVSNESGRDNLELCPSIVVKSSNGTPLLHLNGQYSGCAFRPTTTISRLSLSIDCLPLAPGQYLVNLWLGSGQTCLHWVKDGYSFRVAAGSFKPGLLFDTMPYPVVMPARWRCVG